MLPPYLEHGTIMSLIIEALRVSPAIACRQRGGSVGLLALLLEPGSEVSSNAKGAVDKHPVCQCPKLILWSPSMGPESRILV